MTLNELKECAEKAWWRSLEARRLGILRLLLDQLLPTVELGGGGFEARFGLRVPATLVRVRFQKTLY